MNTHNGVRKNAESIESRILCSIVAHVGNAVLSFRFIARDFGFSSVLAL